MITVLLNWGYIFIITYLIGLGFFKLLSILLKRPFTITFFSSILCGIAVTTVYAQMLSLFCKIGFFANLFLVILCIVTVIIYPRSFYKKTLQKIKLTFFSWQGLLYIGLILFYCLLYIARYYPHRYKLVSCTGNSMVRGIWCCKRSWKLAMAFCIQQFLFCICISI